MRNGFAKVHKNMIVRKKKTFHLVSPPVMLWVQNKNKNEKKSVTSTIILS